ncbi:hypothetical protein AB6A23_11225 [Paenibacillus tarimensis]
MAAVPDPNKKQIDKNQHTYLSNMAKGITSTGGQANEGQMKWANAQLAQSSYVPDPVQAPKAPAAAPASSPAPAPVPAPVQPAQQPTPSSLQPQMYMDWNKRMEDQYSRLQGMMNQDFNYNPSSDPRYQAYQTLAKSRAASAAKDANLATMEEMNSRGLLQSSLTNTQLSETENKYRQQAETEALAAVPQFYDQARQDYQDKLRNAGELLNFAAGRGDVAYERDYQTGRDAVGDDQWNREFGLKNKEANLNAARLVGADTGKVIKPQEDWGGLYRQAGNADTPLNLAGQNQQFNQDIQSRQQGMNETQTMATLTGFMPDGTPTTAQQQVELDRLWKVADEMGTIPDELADMYGIQRGTQTRDAKEFAIDSAIRQQNADTSTDTNLRQWAELDNRMAGSGGEKYVGMTPNQVLSNIRNNYIEPIYSTDKMGRQEQIGEQMTKDPNKRYQMFLDVVDSNLESQTVEDQVLLSLGFTKQEITQMEQWAQKEFGSGN